MWDVRDIFFKRKKPSRKPQALPLTANFKSLEFFLQLEETLEISGVLPSYFPDEETSGKKETK